MTVIMYCRKNGNHQLCCTVRRRRCTAFATDLGGLELPQGDVDGDTTLSLGLELVEHPGVLERALAELGSLLLAAGRKSNASVPLAAAS